MVQGRGGDGCLSGGCGAGIVGVVGWGRSCTTPFGRGVIAGGSSSNGGHGGARASGGVRGVRLGGRVAEVDAGGRVHRQVLDGEYHRCRPTGRCTGMSYFFCSGSPRMVSTDGLTFRPNYLTWKETQSPDWEAWVSECGERVNSTICDYWNDLNWNDVSSAELVW